MGWLVDERMTRSALGGFRLWCSGPKDHIQTVRNPNESYGQARSLTPAAHQMRQAPSSETMHGPTGVRGVQGDP